MNGLTPMAKRKAVAPIIATLLMVAIAVVGGILIFVFTQGFFTESDVSASSTDKINILGYDLRDVTDCEDLISHLGSVYEVGDVANCDDMEIDGQLEDDSVALVYVENLGASPVVISKVRVGDGSYLYVGTAAAAIAENSYPGDGKFALCTSTTSCGIDTSHAGTIASLGAFSTGTLYLEFDTSSTDLKNGRSTSISVETDNSGVATISAKIGKQRGA